MGTRTDAPTHTVRLIAAEFVQAFRKSGKHDATTIIQERARIAHASPHQLRWRNKWQLLGRSETIVIGRERRSKRHAPPVVQRTGIAPPQRRNQSAFSRR
jgi:hypothetical protein